MTKVSHGKSKISISNKRHICQEFYTGNEYCESNWFMALVEDNDFQKFKILSLKNKIAVIEQQLAGLRK